MELSLKGKNALVCGGSKGIGYACAHSLASLGCRVTLLSRGEDLLRNAVDELNDAFPGGHDYFAADLTNPGELSDSLAGRNEYHILVLNSGGPKAGNMIDASTDDLQQIFNSFILSNQILVQQCFPFMKAATYGRIINIISIGLKEPIAGLGVSNTIRGAVGNWSKSLAGELGQHGITVNNILPGYTLTDRLDKLMEGRAAAAQISKDDLIDKYLQQIPLRRLADPSEVGDVVAFLASPAAGYVNGINLPVDGGVLKSL